MKKKYFLIIAFLILAMFLVSCNGNGGTTPPITPNQSPTASFTANPTSGVAPLEVSFNASNSSDSDGTIINYQWDFKDGYTGNGVTVNHTFSSAGSYNVKLTVTDNEGATDSATKNITVTDSITTNQSPTASFTANPTSGVSPLQVTFNASSSYDSDGTIVSYQWDFKDGNTGSGETISHTFSSIGSYNVELTVTDNEGASDSATKNITVTTAPTIAKLYLVAEDGTYLGKLTTNKFDSDSIFNEYGTYGSKYSSKSIWNEYGTYGSKYSSKSIWNEYGTYGSKYSSQSAFNDYTFTPPYIVTSDGTIYGRLTTNKFISGAISPYSIYAILLELGL